MEINYRTQLTTRWNKIDYERLIEVQRFLFPDASLNQVIIFIFNEYYEEIFKLKKWEGVINVFPNVNC